MSTSDIDARQESKKQAFKTAFIYLLISLFCIFFGAVYETFSHEVYSYYMIYAFAFPLVGGTLGFFLIALSKAGKYPSSSATMLYHTGIAVLTVSSLLRGVLDIYGTSNHLIGYFWIIGIVLVVVGVILGILSMRGKA